MVYNYPINRPRSAIVIMGKHSFLKDGSETWIYNEV